MGCRNNLNNTIISVIAKSLSLSLIFLFFIFGESSVFLSSSSIYFDVSIPVMPGVHEDHYKVFLILIIMNFSSSYFPIIIENLDNMWPLPISFRKMENSEVDRNIFSIL